MSASRGVQTQPTFTLTYGDRQWVLGDGEHLVGRGADVAVRIQADGVSRHHARVTVRGGRATIEDLGSKNGTFAGEDGALTRVAEPRPLRDCDVIRLGRRVRLVFHERDDDATASEAASTHHVTHETRPTQPTQRRRPPEPDRESERHGAQPQRGPRQPRLPPDADRGGGAEFRRDGELWTLTFAGQVARLPDAKGLHDLARLLARPGVEIHCLELADRPLESAAADPVLDERARREIRARAQELQREIEAADAAHDLGRAEQAREELDRLTEQLAAGLGLRGRSRGLGSAAERARSSVTWRIRSAIARIEAVHPRLARHLRNAIRTGTFCAYQPEAPVEWRL